MTKEEIVRQLNEIYYKYEFWHTKKLDKEAATRYHTALLNKGNILYYQLGDELLGYVEFWCINFEQFGRLVCHETFCADTEDTVSGNICYVANTWIHPHFRDGPIYKILKKEYFRKNGHCTYHVGSALRKKTQPIKVFKPTEKMKERYLGGNSDGKR